MRTDFCDLLGIEHPIVAAPMGPDLTGPELVAAVSNAGGLIRWPVKLLLPVGFALMVLQGISELIKRVAVARGLIPDPHATQVHALEAEVEHVVESMRKD